MSNQKSNEKVQLSIRSFYKQEVQPEQQIPSQTLAAKAGDGFTEVELVNSLDPLSRKWDPDREYKKLAICHIHAGPKHISFMGRIVNMKSYFGTSTEQPKASGWHQLIIKDDTGAIFVKLYFATTPFPLQLGLLITLWTAFVSEKLPGNVQEQQQQLLVRKNTINVNMFPGRVTSDHILIHHKTSSSMMNICRRPLEYQATQELPQLVPLDSYLKSGHDDVNGIKILVIVRNIGPSRKVKRKDDSRKENEVADVGLMDNTAECCITLWNDVISSAHTWRPKDTVLLITNPGYRSPCSIVNHSRGGIQISQHTMIEVDPNVKNAHWLRQWAKRKARQEAITWEPTEDDWGFETSLCGTIRKFFTLAELDNWTRSDWSKSFTGYINVIIRNMNICRLHQRSKLMCGQCCGNLLYSNSSVSECATCGKPTSLLPNPSVVGQLLDETGCINGSSLQWSPKAWENLFGRPPEVISAWSAGDCDLFEQRLCFLRIHLHVGWRQAHVSLDKKSSIAKLSVLGVHM